MNLNELTIRLIILFLPGILCSLIVARLTTHRDLRPSDHIIPSLVYGFLVFVAYTIIARLWNSWAEMDFHLPTYQLIPTADSQSRAVPVRAIVFALLVAFGFAFLLAALRNHKVLNRTARLLRVTRKFGDRDVWSYVMNLKDTEWLVIRDRTAGLYYVGRLAVFSDEESVRELVMHDTVVYDNQTGDKRYDAGTVYFSFPFEGVTIELFPGRQEDE